MRINEAENKEPEVNGEEVKSKRISLIRASTLTLDLLFIVASAFSAILNPFALSLILPKFYANSAKTEKPYLEFVFRRSSS